MIEGKKTRLRALEEHDLDFCQFMYNDRAIREMVVGWDFPASQASQKKWLESQAGDRNNIRLLIETKEGKRIGLTGLWDIDWHNRHALTGIKLNPEGVKGQGYGRDAIMTMNAYSFFEVGLRRLWNTILDFNIPSFKSYVEKSGWKVEGRWREHIFRNGAFHDVFLCGILKSDFLAVPDAADYIPQPIPAGMKKIDPGPGAFFK
jgi:RimJ/RimL family protein N-acetyltransferase